MAQQPMVYIVDDDRDYLEMLQEELEASGILTTGFNSGKELFDVLNESKEHPTTILLDYVLTPAMPGTEVLYRLHKKYISIPIIIYSGQDRRGAVNAFGGGAYATLIKSSDNKEFKSLDVKELKSSDTKELVDIVFEIFNQQAIFRTMAEDVIALTGFDCSIVWQLSKENYAYSIVGWAGKIDRDYRQKTTFDYDSVPWIENLRNGNIYYCSDVLNPQITPNYQKREEAESRKWRTLITIPLVRGDRVLGWIDCYSLIVDKINDDKEREKLEFYLNKYAVQASETLRSDALTRQLRMIQEITQKLTWAASEPDLFRIILKKAMEYTGASIGRIYKLDIINNELELGWAEGSSGNQTGQLKKTLDKGLTATVARTGEYKYIDNNQNDEIRSQLAVPIKRGEQQILGVITLKSKRRDFFTSDDIQLLQSLAASAAVVIDQVKLTRHLQDISRMAQDESSEEKLIQHVVKAARELTHARVVFWEPSRKEGEGDHWMRVAASAGDFSIDFLNDAIPNDPSKSSNARALNENRPIIISDLKDKKSNEPFYHEGQLDFLSFMAIPLLSKSKEQLGVISLYSEQKNDFTEDGSQLIMHIASQTSLALQEQRHLRSLQELSNIGENLSVGLPNTREQLEKVAELGKRISKADFTVLYPFDTKNLRFFDKDAIVSSGEIRTRIKDQTSKPRENGMASLAKKYRAIIVEDVNGQEIRVGLNTNNTIIGAEDKAIIIKGINDSSFIQGEKIGSFISISLRAGETALGKEPLEVGVLYFNYRSPQRFSVEELRVIDIFARNTANIIYRNRLLDQTQKQSQLVEAVNKAGLSILEQQDRQKQLKGIIKAGIDLLKAKGGKIYLTVNGDLKDARLEAGVNLPKGVKIGQVVTNGKGMVGEVIKTKQAKWNNNYSTYPNRIEEFVDFFSAVVEVPLMHHEQVIGVLSIFDNNEKHQFGEEDANALSKLAAQASVAIYNLQLYEELEGLYQAGLRVTADIDLYKTGRNILGELRKVISYKKATIQLFSDTSKSRKILVSSNRKEKIAQYNRHLLRPVENDPLITSILGNQSPEIVTDTHLNVHWDKTIPETKDIRSWACIPLIYGNNIFGLITIEHDQVGFFQKKHEGRLKRFGTQASIAIQNALFFERIQKQKTAFEEVTNKITSGIANSSQTDLLYESLAEAAIHLFEGTHLAEIYILDAEEDMLNRVVYKGSVNLEESQKKYSTATGIVGQAYASGHAILVANVRENSNYEKILESTHSEIVAPIRIDNETIGFLNIEHPKVGGLSEKDKSLAEALCNLIAIAKQRGDLKENLKLMGNFLSSVHEIADLREDEKNGMEGVMAILARYALNINPNISGCTFYMLEKNFFSIKKVEQSLKKLRNSIKEVFFLMGEGLAGWVAQEGQAILISNTQHDYRIETPMDAKSLALSPLWSGGRIIGVFALESSHKNAFSAQELSVLEGLTLLVESSIYQFEQAKKKKGAILRRFNPYIVGSPVKHPDDFFGRQEVLTQLINSLHHNHYFIRGARRIGKTSLLIHLKHQLEKLDDLDYAFFPVLYDLQGIKSDDFFVEFMRRIIQNLDLIDVIKLPERGQYYDHYLFQDDLDQALIQLEQKAGGRMVRMVALVDEIQKFDDFDPILAEQLRRILLRDERLKMVMAGVQFFEQSGSKVSPFNIHVEIVIAAFEEADARKLILEPVQPVYSYQEEAIRAILKKSDLEPMRIQKICKDAINKMLSRVKINSEIQPIILLEDLKD